VYSAISNSGLTPMKLELHGFLQLFQMNCSVMSC